MDWTRNLQGCRNNAYQGWEHVHVATGVLPSSRAHPHIIDELKKYFARSGVLRLTWHPAVLAALPPVYA